MASPARMPTRPPASCQPQERWWPAAPMAPKTSTTPLSKANSPHKRISTPSVTPGLARASTPSTTLSTPCNNTNHQWRLNALTTVSMMCLLSNVARLTRTVVLTSIHQYARLGARRVPCVWLSARLLGQVLHAWDVTYLVVAPSSGLGSLPRQPVGVLSPTLGRLGREYSGQKPRRGPRKRSCELWAVAAKRKERNKRTGMVGQGVSLSSGQQLIRAAWRAVPGSARAGERRASGRGGQSPPGRGRLASLTC